MGAGAPVVFGLVGDWLVVAPPEQASAKAEEQARARSVSRMANLSSGGGSGRLDGPRAARVAAAHDAPDQRERDAEEQQDGDERDADADEAEDDPCGHVEALAESVFDPADEAGGL